MTEETKFWADQVAAEIVAAGKGKVAATGITPSGEIHIGNMREVVTADVAVRAVTALGSTPQFIYIADTYDPLRRVYPFLKAEKYQPHIGSPLSEIPCPCDRHPSYAEHFLEPFLRSLETLDIRMEVLRADQLYKEGRYTKNIFRALEATNKIREILKKETGKATEDDWSPFNPICNACKHMTGTKVVGFRADKEEIDYQCDCGDKGTVTAKGGGKLTWRVDWPARWEMLGVTIEPFGKDHASAGGSYDTGVRIVREVFGAEPPFPIVYEWISLRGGGDMSSSKGNVISIADMLETVPPDVLKYSVLKTKPNRSIVFDPGLPLLSLIDEYDDLTSANRNARAAEFATVHGRAPVGAPFRHLVMLTQTTQDKVTEIAAILKRNGYEALDMEMLAARVKYARKWLDRFAPEDLKFSLQPKLPEMARSLTPQQKSALRIISEKLRSGMNADDIHQLIYSVKDEAALTPNLLFEAIYKSLLGKAKGPRAGFFLASLDAGFVKRRFEEAAA